MVRLSKTKKKSLKRPSKKEFKRKNSFFYSKAFCKTMTENQLFSMSTELFDTSSNSSNPLKYDLYSLGLSTSVGSSATALFATFTTTSSAGGSGCSNSGTNSLFSGGSSSGNQNISGSSNVMLTNAITIPRSNNPNQSHNPYQDEAQTQHHPTSSPLFCHLLQHQQLQQQQQQQNLQQQEQMNAMMSSTSNNLQQNQQQQPAGLLATTNLSDYSDYALDALDASLSPTLLQDVSLSAAVTQSLNSGHNSSTSITSPFYKQDPSSPLSANAGSIGSTNGSNGSGNNDSGGGGSSSSGGLSISSSTDITGVIKFFNTPANNEDSSSLLYDSNLAPNSMWSDIGSAISTKNEPFTLDDNYIGDVNTNEFGDFEGEIVSLEDIGNLEEFLPSSGSQDGGHSFHLLSPSLHAAAQASTPSPGMGPPMELLQQQQQQEQHNMQHFSQLQTNTSNGGGNNTENNANSSNSNNNTNAIQIQQQQQQNHQSSSSPYEIYHSTPNKQQLQHNNTFSPGSLPSHSPLQMNSITPPPPQHANRSQYQQSQVKSRNIQELLKKDFSISPDRNHDSTSLLGHSVPGSHGMLMAHNITLSPSSGSSGFGSTNGANIISGSSSHTTSIVGPVISLNAARKQFYEGNAVSRLSSSAPTHLGPADIWMRREPRQHLLSTGSLAEAESFSSLSTGSVLSPDGHDYSQDDDEDNSTEYNSDNYDDLSSDNGSDNEDDSSTIHGRVNSSGSNHHLSSSKGKERFFWQYNVQAKGPKGKRLVFQSKLEDPHVLNEVTDPVFSPNCSVRGIKVYKHSGKARKGDGNDLTPNPRKLNNIGKELDILSRTINDMTPVSELPFNVRPKSRKEKNKLASRACRLKKKAQHEANKIKLYGLEIEHKRLLNAITDIKQNLALKYRKQNAGENFEDVDQQIERIYKHAIGGLAIAGSSTEFVNKVLENVKNGQPSGGLEELRNT